MRSPSARDALRELGVKQTISAEQLIAHTLAKSLEAPHAGDMLADLVESRKHCLAEIEADAEAVGKQLSAVREERSELVLGIVHEAGSYSASARIRSSAPVIACSSRSQYRRKRIRSSS